MHRHLTPSKITLLILADLYLTTNEIPQTAQLAILKSISSQIIQPSESDDIDIETRLKASTSDISYFEDVLSKLPSVIPGRSVYDRLLTRIWALDGLDTLFVFFEQVKGLVVAAGAKSAPGSVHASIKAKVSRFSPLGQFIKRCSHEFERLQFPDVQKLYAALQAYRSSSYSIWSKLNPQKAATLPPITQTASASLDTGFASDQEITTLLSLSLHALQKLGTRIPAAIRTNLHSWLQMHQISASSNGAGQSLHYFLAFFEHWRAGQMTAALESLHRYFDYSIGAGASAGGAGAESGANGGNANGNASLKVYFQYAQLHQSVLYADFGCWEESLRAMGECIATARENQDTTCLAYALSWLLHLRQLHPATTTAAFEDLIKLLGGSGAENDEIAFLKTKARESKNWGLLSRTLLEEARSEWVAGDNLSKAFEHVLQASFLNVTHDQRGLMAASTLFESAGFERLGQSRLSHRITESTALFSPQYTPLADHVQATCRLSHTHSQMGQYASALKLLSALKQRVKGVLKLQQRIEAFSGLVKGTLLIFRGNTEEARTVLADLAVLASTAGPEVEFEVFLLRVQLLLAEGDGEMAMAAVNARIAESKSSRTNDIQQSIRLSLLKCKIFLLSDNSGKAFTLAIRAAATAQRLLLMPLLVEAIGVLSGILVELGEYAAARDLGEAGVIHAFGIADLRLRAELFETLADAYVGLALPASSDTTEPSSEEHTSLAVRNLDRGCLAFARLESRAATSRCLLKKMELLRWIGNEAEEARAADPYRKLFEAGNTLAIYPKREGNGQAEQLWT